MFQLRRYDHVEDWYVAEWPRQEFASLDEAVAEFEKRAQELLRQDFENDGLDDFIWDTCNSNGETPEESGLSYGCCVDLLESDEVLASAYFAYDPINKRVLDSEVVDIPHGGFSLEQRKRLEAACKRAMTSDVVEL